MADPPTTTCRDSLEYHTIYWYTLIMEGDTLNGWYVTGFADGESWFFARPLLRGYKKDRSIQVSWSIQLRDDEEELLYKISKYLGVGTITFRKSRSKVNSGQVTLNVYGVENANKLIEHFTEYPLQGKKKKDYEVWKRIVGKLSEGFHLKSDENFLKVVKMCDELRLVRLYRRTEDQLKAVSGSGELYIDKVLKRM